MQTLTYKGKTRQIPQGTIINVMQDEMVIKALDFKTFDRDAYAYYSLWLKASYLEKIETTYLGVKVNKYGDKIKVYVAK